MMNIKKKTTKITLIKERKTKSSYNPCAISRFYRARVHACVALLCSVVSSVGVASGNLDDASLRKKPAVQLGSNEKASSHTNKKKKKESARCFKRGDGKETIEMKK